MEVRAFLWGLGFFGGGLVILFCLFQGLCAFKASRESDLAYRRPTHNLDHKI